MKTLKVLTVTLSLPFFAACAMLYPPPPPRSEPAPRPVIVNPFQGFEQVRKDETDVAEKTRQDLIELFSKQRYQHNMVIEPVSYITITVTDANSHMARQFRVVDSLQISMPLSFKRKVIYKQVTDKVKEMAENLADERGSAEIRFFYNPADVHAHRIKLVGGVAPTAKNNPVSVVKQADAGTPRGAMHIVVKGAMLPGHL